MHVDAWAINWVMKMVSGKGGAALWRPVSFSRGFTVTSLWNIPPLISLSTLFN